MQASYRWFLRIALQLSVFVVLFLWLSCTSGGNSSGSLRKDLPPRQRHALRKCERWCAEESQRKTCDDGCWQRLVIDRLRVYFRYKAPNDSPVAWIDSAGNLVVHFGHVLMLSPEVERYREKLEQHLKRIATRVRGEMIWTIEEPGSFMMALGRANNTLPADADKRLKRSGKKENSVRVRVAKGDVRASDSAVIRKALYETKEVYTSQYPEGSAVPQMAPAVYILVGADFTDPDTGKLGIELSLVNLSVVYAEHGGISNVAVTQEQIVPITTESILCSATKSDSKYGSSQLIRHILDKDPRKREPEPTRANKADKVDTKPVHSVSSLAEPPTSPPSDDMDLENLPSTDSSAHPSPTGEPRSAETPPENKAKTAASTKKVEDVPTKRVEAEPDDWREASDRENSSSEVERSPVLALEEELARRSPAPVMTPRCSDEPPVRLFEPVNIDGLDCGRTRNRKIGPISSAASFLRLCEKEKIPLMYATLSSAGACCADMACRLPTPEEIYQHLEDLPQEQVQAYWTDESARDPDTLDAGCIYTVIRYDETASLLECRETSDDTAHMVLCLCQ